MSDEWSRPKSPPPPLFLGKKERDLVKQVNDELIEKVIGQQILYYPIDIERTNFHELYGEAIKKSFLPPVRVYAMVCWLGDRQTSPSHPTATPALWVPAHAYAVASRSHT